MEQKRKEHDAKLAEIDPDKLPAAIKVGIASAMVANPIGPFWGGEEHHSLKESQTRIIGCMPELKIPHDIRGMMGRLDKDMAAREFVQIYTGPESYNQIPNPEPCTERSPIKPNAYADGSVLNPKGLHWALGGLGVWWPQRKEPQHP